MFLSGLESQAGGLVGAQERGTAPCAGFPGVVDELTWDQKPSGGRVTVREGHRAPWGRYSPRPQYRALTKLPVPLDG
jgi:hypothetical protein